MGSSTNAYINYLAVNRKRAIKRHFDSSLESLKKELLDSRQREKAIRLKLEGQGEKLEKLQREYSSLMEGKNFMRLLMALNKKQRQISEVLSDLQNQKFDIVLRKNGN